MFSNSLIKTLTQSDIHYEKLYSFIIFKIRTL